MSMAVIGSVSKTLQPLDLRAPDSKDDPEAKTKTYKQWV
jgi:hypothetical protein